MIDFLLISTRSSKRGVIEVYPKFIIKKSSDLMIRGGDFYAIWIEEKGLWSTDEEDALQLIDREIDRFIEKNKNKFDLPLKALYMWDAESGMIDIWHKYCQRQMRDSFHSLDENLIFSNHQTVKQDYASRILDYPLEPCDTPAYDKIMSTLYSDEERHKIEWAIGSIVNGDSKKIQKFLVLYGAPGTGKSTVLNIIQKLFDGYYSVFDAKALGSSSNSFALEAFKSNPLVAIQHDGDLSRIEDNTRLNSVVSHEEMTVNEKFKSAYTSRFKCFLFLGTNKPVKISDAKSGLIRRLIDVEPTGNKLTMTEYRKLTKQVNFELGGIACHCKEVYESNPGIYDDYIPTNMLGASNDFYNFIQDSYFVFKDQNGTTLKAAWEMYKTYCDDAKVSYPLSQRAFKEELRNYFDDYKDRYALEDGTRVRSYYIGFKADKFQQNIIKEEQPEKPKNHLIEFNNTESIFDKVCANYPAQYANDKGTPLKKWNDVTTKLSDLDTSKLHYVKVPENHIVIDFDIPDENGNKSFEKNLEEASKWPTTYAELSKSGAGIHLHYIYTGDPSKLSRVYDDHIEIKVFNGNSSLRRKLSKCNNSEIATISSGLPLKGEKMISKDTIKSEKGLRTLIKRNLNKEIHPGTKPSIDFIYEILEGAYNNGLYYDVTDMRNAVLAFAANSTHQSQYCINLVNKMKFKSAETSKPVESEQNDIVFYDVEVFKNLFLVNWKLRGKENPVVRMINPKPSEIENLMKFKLVGFNCRRYDNHMLYARLMGYTNEQLYNLSQKIISGEKNAFFGEAYNISYTDIYDFAAKKQSLKKWEIELGIHHKELGLPWDQPVPEDKWTTVAEYCDNDVIATEAVFEHLQADFLAREILADLADMTVNDTTNSLTTKIIFGNNRKPQDQFNYRNMGEMEEEHRDMNNIEEILGLNDSNSKYFTYIGEHGEILKEPVALYPISLITDVYEVFDKKGRPIFPGYVYDHGKSTYRGEEVGEGGYVYSEQGMYTNVALLDIASMHPHSVIAEKLFGDEYTKNFEDLVHARIYIKHKEFDKAKSLFNGKLAKYLNDKDTAKKLSQALKIAINSVYGLTSANFDNPFRDIRNKDNIVAKRGALFMINLKHAVQEKGYIVAHIKTDSIKIPNATPEIIKFVTEYGKLYGYNFEHEATYDRMCLVNDAVYIARYSSIEKCYKLFGKDYVESNEDICKENKENPGKWTATGAQFAVPYVFKTLFSKEDIVFEDMCETKSVAKGDLYLDMNFNLPDVSEYENELDKLRKSFKETCDGKIVKPDDFDSMNSVPGTFTDERDRLKYEISKGHNYIFVGRVGQFCPIKPDKGGGILYRCDNQKYYAVTGTKGYRWLESEVVKTLGKEADIDRSYYDKLVNDAVENISQYGDFTWFVANDE